MPKVAAFRHHDQSLWSKVATPNGHILGRFWARCRGWRSKYVCPGLGPGLGAWSGGPPPGGGSHTPSRTLPLHIHVHIHLHIHIHIHYIYIDIYIYIYIYIYLSTYTSISNFSILLRCFNVYSIHTYTYSFATAYT